MPNFTGGARVQFEWTPSLEVEAAAFVRAAEYVARPELPLARSRQLIIDEVRRAFLEKQSPVSGQPWPEWSKDDDGNQMYTGNELMQLTDDLYDAVTDPANYPISGTSLFVNREALWTSYGEAHQTGLPARKTELPKRDFLGPGRRTEGMIYGTFRRWADGTVAIYERGGGLFMQLREPGSTRFAPGIMRIL